MIEIVDESKKVLLRKKINKFTISFFPSNSNKENNSDI